MTSIVQLVGGTLWQSNVVIVYGRRTLTDKDMWVRGSCTAQRALTGTSGIMSHRCKQLLQCSAPHGGRELGLAQQQICWHGRT